MLIDCIVIEIFLFLQTKFSCHHGRSQGHFTKTCGGYLVVTLMTRGTYPHDTWEFPLWHLGVSFRCVRVLRCRITQFPLVILNSLSKNYSRMLSETWIHMACPWYTPFTYVFWYCKCNNNCNSQYWSHIWQKVHPPISEDSNSSIPTTEKSFDFL